MSARMEIHFPGGKKVDSDYKGFTIETDQSKMSGGDGSAPAPFDLFLSSIGTCAGIYVLSFCQQRQLSTTGIRLIQKIEWDSTKKMVASINLEIQVPSEFPAKYHAALVRVADLCAVKRHLMQPPDIKVSTVVAS